MQKTIKMERLRRRREREDHAKHINNSHLGMKRTEVCGSGIQLTTENQKENPEIVGIVCAHDNKSAVAVAAAAAAATTTTVTAACVGPDKNR